MKIVLDTNVVVAAIQPGRQASRRVLKWCFEGKLTPQLSNALFLEYEEITRRGDVMQSCHFTTVEAEEFLDALLSVSQWVAIYYAWRPNLPDEDDDYLIELAIASGAEYIVTHNVKDLLGGEITFDQFDVVTPSTLVEKLRNEV